MNSGVIRTSRVMRPDVHVYQASQPYAITVTGGEESGVVISALYATVRKAREDVTKQLMRSMRWQDPGAVLTLGEERVERARLVWERLVPASWEPVDG